MAVQNILNSYKLLGGTPQNVSPGGSPNFNEAAGGQFIPAGVNGGVNPVGPSGGINIPSLQGIGNLGGINLGGLGGPSIAYDPGRTLGMNQSGGGNILSGIKGGLEGIANFVDKNPKAVGLIGGALGIPFAGLAANAFSNMYDPMMNPQGGMGGFNGPNGWMSTGNLNLGANDMSNMNIATGNTGMFSGLSNWYGKKKGN